MFNLPAPASVSTATDVPAGDAEQPSTSTGGHTVQGSGSTAEDLPQPSTHTGGHSVEPVVITSASSDNAQVLTSDVGQSEGASSVGSEPGPASTSRTRRGRKRMPRYIF